MSIRTGSNANCYACFQSLLRSSIIYANAVESLVKLITCNDVPGSVEEWYIPGKTAGKWGHYRLQTRTVERLENSTSDSLLGDVSLIQKATLELYSRNVPLLYTSGCVIARHQFHQAFPHVSIASDKHWGEKTWVRGKVSIGFSVACSICPHK